MPAVLSKVSPGPEALSHLIAQAGNDGKYLPTLALAVLCEDETLIAKYRGRFMLVQGRIREREPFEYTSHRILTDEIGMTLPDVESALWKESVTQITLYHRNDWDASRRSTDLLGKMLTFVKVTVTDMRTNLQTEWNRTREPNPPESVEWVRIQSLKDIEMVREHYFNSIRTNEKREAELAILALAHGLPYSLPM